MEAVNKYGLLFAFALVLLIRVPFLNQAIQGDDHIYLTEAEHALVDPLHPSDVKYVFLGDEVDLRGHSHPPGNAWPLAAVILLAGDVKEIPFHAAYIIFSLIAVWAMWSLARRFSNHPLWATLLFIAVPAFVINGGSLEADLPFLAFWMASVALFIGQKAPLATGRSSDPPRDASDPSFDSDPTCASDPPRDTSYPSRDRKGAVVLSALAMALAAMMAYQAVFLIPILGAYCWIYHRRDKARWITLATPLLTLIAWQLFTRLTTGTMPAGKLAEYFDHYGFQAISHKLKSALMLAIHSGWIVFPALLPVTIVQAWRRRHEPDTRFLLAWIAIFFAGAIVLFFSGSARYLLPMAAPVCILTSRTGSKWLAPGFALQLALALALAAVNYQHWDGYRIFAATLRAPTAGKRVWVDNDWGLRYYLEADHALPARKTQHVRSGDIVVTSELGHNIDFTAPLTLFTSETIQSPIPFRLIGLNSHSGYSTVEEGFLPFGISRAPIDRVLARVVKERRVTQEFLKIHSPESAEQIVAGIDASDGWTSKSASVVLKPPSSPRKLRAEFYIPPNAKARTVTLVLDGREVATHTYPGPGPYSLESATPLQGTSVEIRVDQTFTAPGDQRALGMVLTAVGFVQ